MTSYTSMARAATDYGTAVPQNDDVDRWLYRPRPVARPRLRLFCFPYAGGNATLFRGWPIWLPSDIEVCAVALPGRGARIDEPPRRDLLSLSRDIAGVITQCSPVPFAFFGHSFGALLAFEVTRVLRERGAPAPAHLFVSARQAPDHAAGDLAPAQPVHDADFLARLIRLGGTPPEVLHDEQLMALLLPSLKADFIALDQWRYRAEKPLRVPISAIAGSEDRAVDAEAVRRWCAHTVSDFVFHLLHGDHFFIHSSEQKLVGLLVRTLVDLPRDG